MVTELQQKDINVAELKMKVANLQDAILQSNPLMPTLLRTIHTNLRTDPENVTLLSEEEIGVVISGLLRQTRTEIAAKVTKGAGKSMKNISVDDL